MSRAALTLVHDTVPHDLATLEAVIADGLRSFVEVGRALAAIREKDLYREQGFETFESYCAKRWEFTRMRAHQLMAGAKVAENVNHGLREPAELNERQARELARLKEPDAQAKAWAEAVQTAPTTGVTARHVADVVAKRLPPVEPAEAAEPQRKATTPEIAAFHARCVVKAMGELWNIADHINKVDNWADVELSPIAAQDYIADLREVDRALAKLKAILRRKAAA